MKGESLWVRIPGQHINHIRLLILGAYFRDCWYHENIKRVRIALAQQYIREDASGLTPWWFPFIASVAEGVGFAYTGSVKAM